MPRAAAGVGLAGAAGLLVLAPLALALALIGAITAVLTDSSTNGRPRSHPCAAVPTSRCAWPLRPFTRCDGTPTTT